MLRLSIVVSLAACCLTSSQSFAKPFQTQGVASARFHATGPAGLKIEGTTAEMSLKDDDTTLTIVVHLASFDTGIALRNRHMREKYLQVDKYPDAVLTVTKASVSLPAEGNPTTADAPGKLALHGKEQATSIHYEIVRHGETLEVVGKLALNINDYGIETPSYLGVSVKPAVEVDVRFVVGQAAGT